MCVSHFDIVGVFENAIYARKMLRSQRELLGGELILPLSVLAALFEVMELLGNFSALHEICALHGKYK